MRWGWSSFQPIGMKREVMAIEDETDIFRLYPKFEEKPLLCLDDEALSF